MAKPLTKKRLRNGALYNRPPEVEANINGAIDQPLDVLQRRLLVNDAPAPDYLKSESLVHLLRLAIESGDQERISALYGALVRRVERRVERAVSRRLPNVPPHVAEEVQLGILFAFNELFSPRSNALDFYEVKFNKAFQTLCIGKLPREEPPPTVELHEQRPYGDQGRSMQERSALSSDLAAALDTLPKEERDAFLLVEKIGFRAESVDAHEKTAATICGVSGRTIRTRLDNAKRKLAAILKDHDS